MNETTNYNFTYSKRATYLDCVQWLGDNTELPRSLIISMADSKTVKGLMERLRKQPIYNLPEAEEARSYLRAVVADHNMTIENLCDSFAKHARGETGNEALEKEFGDSCEGMRFYSRPRTFRHAGTKEEIEFIDLDLQAQKSVHPVLALQARLVHQFWARASDEIRRAFRNTIEASTDVLGEDHREVPLEMRNGVLHYDVIANGKRQEGEFLELGKKIYFGLAERKIFCTDTTDGAICIYNFEPSEYFRSVTDVELKKAVSDIINEWRQDKILERQARLSAESPRDSGPNLG